jgi:uncharacterized protein
VNNSGFNPEGLIQSIRQTNGPAPVHLWNPPFCGDIDMRIASDGSWHYQNSPIQRAAMVKLFSSILRLEADGHYYLVTPVEKVRIQVDDCPFAAHLLEVEGSGHEQKLWFITNTEERILADIDHPIEVTTDPITSAPHPRLLCRSNLYALISRSVFYQLAELLEQRAQNGKEVAGVWSAGSFFALESIS